MNIDMVNLGPPLKALPDLKTSSKKSEEVPTEKGPGTFEQTMKAREVTGPPVKETAKAQIKKIDKEKVDPDTKDSIKEPAETKQFGEMIQEVGQKAKLSDRQKVMQKFMDSIESEFGIPPEKVLEAMTQLSDTELLLSPEQTAPQVIEKLGLDSEEANKAQAMYVAMVMKLSGMPATVKDPQALAPENKAMLQTALAGGGMAAVLATRERKEVLNQSLDRMNSQFFIKPEKALPTEMGDLMVKTPSIEDVKAQFSPEAQAKLAELQRQMKVPDEMNTQDLKAALAAIGGSAAAIGQATKQDSEGQAAPNTNFMVTTPSASPVAGLYENPSKGFDTSTSEKDSGENQFTEGEKSSLQTLTSGHSKPEAFSLHPTDAPVSGAGAMMAAGGREGDQEVNIQAVMKQAQYMIKKGGGEANVQMSPEGMGQVHLKIMINEGKVNLEMKTESNEAKKLIESSIGDLRTSLGIHKLAVDSVKVDVSNQLANNSDHQKPTEQGFRQDPGREQARQFLHQFKEENASRKDPFYETTGVKAYSRSQPTQGLRAADETSKAQSKRYQGAGKGSGLNLVA